jgi:hypothetical protein
METRALADVELIDSLEAANRAIYGIKSCQSEAEVQGVLRKLLPYFGLEWYVFVILRRDDPSPESYRFFIGCLPEWCQIYNARKWFAIDPFIQYALRNTSPVLGSAIQPESPGQAELLAVAAKYGFRSGMVIPVHGGIKSRVGVLYLGTSKEPEAIEAKLLEQRNLLRAIAMELFEWWVAKMQAEALGGLRFDDLDLELLRFEHEGFTSEEAAKELGISPSKINNRFRRINMKLNVHSKKLAAEKAIELGLLRS